MSNVSKFCFVLSAAVSMFAAGCDDGGDGTTATGGTTGAGGAGSGGGGATSTAGAPTGDAVAVTPDESGYVVASSNSLGIQGAWYPYGDNAGDKKTCTMAGHMAADCSVITSPDPALMSFPNTGGRMCTKGTVAKVLPKIGGTGAADLDYGSIWGAGIGFDLNVPTDGTKMPFNATAAGIKGISFDLEMPTPSGLRVEFAIPATENHTDGAAYFGATSSWPPSPVAVGANTVTWDKVKQPTEKVPFDPTQILSIQFHVPTNGTASQNYEFCISNLKFLK